MRRFSRPALLAVAALLAGGANDAGLPEDMFISAVPATGAYGDYLAGRAAGRAGDAREAAPMLKAALALEPDNAELLTQAMITSVLAGEPDAELAAQLPGNMVGRLVLLHRDVLAGNWLAAQAKAGALPDEGLTQLLRPVLVAWTQQGGGQTEAALATLAPYVAGQRVRGLYALHAALIADQGSRPGESARLYRTAREEFASLNLRLGVILASWQARVGHADEAHTIIHDTLATAPDLAIAEQALVRADETPAVATAADGMAEAYLALAASMRAQDPSNAPNVLLELALQLRPSFTAARLLLAENQAAVQHPEAALATLAPIGDDDPLASVAALRRGALLTDAGRFDEAEKVLRRTAEARPDRSEPIALLADTERRDGKFADAVRDYDKAVDLLGAPSAANWPLFYERGVALDRSGQWPRAEADFEQALKLSPDQPFVLNYLGYGWTERGINLDRARTMLERAVELKPEDGAIVDSLGWVLLRQGDAVEATQRLERAVELDPEDASVNGHLGDAYQRQGRLREAEFQWRRALNLKPDEDEQKRIEAKLKELPTN